MQQKIERVEVRKLKALDGSETDPLKMVFHRVGSDVLSQERVVLRLKGNESHIPRIALIARPGVRYVQQLDLHLFTRRMIILRSQ